MVWSRTELNTWNFPGGSETFATYFVKIITSVFSSSRIGPASTSIAGGEGAARGAFVFKNKTQTRKFLFTSNPLSKKYS